jgi:glycosyltransferase involved in cell wall biosynthesis
LDTRDLIADNGKRMRLLVPVSAIDMRIKFGIVPAWWQLLKALSEKGCDLTVIPFYGKAFETLWWRSSNNCLVSDLYLRSMHGLGHSFESTGSIAEKIIADASQTTKVLLKPLLNLIWTRNILRLLEKDGKYSGVLFLGAGLRFTNGLPTLIRKRFRIPVVYFENDLPSTLFWKDSPYLDRDLLDDYDAIIVTSKGSKDILIERGLRNIHVIYFGVDPSVFQPISVKKDIDIGFFGLGRGREKYIRYMLVEPSNAMQDKTFAVGGGKHGVNLGTNIQSVGFTSFLMFRLLSCRSKINLNIVRHPFDEIFGSSISRPFELGAMGCCVVSNPWNGIEEWFDVGKEILIVRDFREAVDIYNMLLSDEDLRIRLGDRLRKKILKEHTYAKRAEQIICLLKELNP